MTVKLEDGNLNPVSRIMEIANLNPVYCNENNNLSEVVNKTISLNHRRLPVLSKGDKLVGMVTYMDILDALLRGMSSEAKISNIMTRDIVTSNEDESIWNTFQKLKMSRRGGLPIVHNQKLMGLVTERDFVKRFIDVNFETKIRNMMTPKPLFIHSRKLSIMDAFKSLVNTRYRRLPVVENKKIVGIVTSYDMILYMQKNNYDFSVLGKPLDTIMKTSVCSISGYKGISEAVKLMKTKDVGGILVTDDGRLEGMITERDVLEQIS